MTDFATVLAALRRPKILIRAARAGVADYRRERDLRRLLKAGHGPAPRLVLDTLLAEEDRLEMTRASGETAYNLQRHVALLTAIIAEARLPPAPCPPPERRPAEARRVVAPLPSAGMRVCSPRDRTPAHCLEPGREPWQAPRRGLAVALADALAERGGVWFGWSGETVEREPRGVRLFDGRRGRVRARRPDPGGARGLLPRLRQPGALAGLSLPRRPRPLRRGASSPPTRR